MSKKFLPFEKLGWRCGPQSKTLHDTMQESPNDKFKDDSHCKPNCVPYWQETGEIRCGDCSNKTLVEVEEADGCGNTRWIRKELVCWTRTGESRCDNEKNRRMYEEANQCGETRWIEGEFLKWEPTDPNNPTIRCTEKKVQQEEINECGDLRWANQSRDVLWESTGDFRCVADILEIRQVNQCGELRWINPGNNVTWTPTGDVRCVADKLEIEEINQCGGTQWRATNDPCPCVPDWVATGQTRCTKAFIEEREDDGCGNTRWVTTTTPVDWFPLDNERCGSNNFIEVEEENQCGTKRWRQTTTACTPEVPPPILASHIFMAFGCCPRAMNTGEAHMFFSLGSNGMANSGSSCYLSPGPSSWLPAGMTPSDYEFMYDHVEGIPMGADGEWFSGAGGFNAHLSIAEGPESQRTLFNLYWRPAGSSIAGSVLGTFEMNLTIGMECT